MKTRLSSKKTVLLAILVLPLSSALSFAGPCDSILDRFQINAYKAATLEMKKAQVHKACSKLGGNFGLIIKGVTGDASFDNSSCDFNSFSESQREKLIITASTLDAGPAFAFYQACLNAEERKLPGFHVWYEDKSLELNHPGAFTVRMRAVPPFNCVEVNAPSGLKRTYSCTNDGIIAYNISNPLHTAAEHVCFGPGVPIKSDGTRESPFTVSNYKPVGEYVDVTCKPHFAGPWIIQFIPNAAAAAGTPSAHLVPSVNPLIIPGKQ